MAKRAAKKKLATEWIEQMDAVQVDAAHEEATVDAYGDYEQHTGLMTALGDEPAFSAQSEGDGRNTSGDGHGMAGE